VSRFDSHDDGEKSLLGNVYDGRMDGKVIIISNMSVYKLNVVSKAKRLYSSNFLVL
jgi:hypothetical protein